MEKYDIYNDVAKRTDGDIYVGVVGPVRTGKSTFVKRFTEQLIVPNIVGKNKKQIATDELPQSGAGRTITTTEPKFIPSEAVKISLNGKTNVRMRLIDCVGFMVEGAIGDTENGEARMVITPWSKEPVTFERAAEIGTEKVITEHSTIGIVVTTDGTVAELSRESYVQAEIKTVKRLKELGKPFVIVLNSALPNSDECKKLAMNLEQEYGVSVVRVNALTCGESEFSEIMEKVLGEFPIKTAEIELPDWLNALDSDNRVIAEIIQAVKTSFSKAEKMKDCKIIEEALAGVEKIIPEKSVSYAGEGRVRVTLATEKSLFYDVLSETCGEAIDGEYKLMSFVRDLSKTKWEYDKVRTALSEAEEGGYGVVMPTEKEVTVSEPTLVKQGNRYGVKINAEAESLHVVKVGVKASVNPISGTKKQCEEFMQFVSEDKENLFNANVFGRPLGGIIMDEMNMRCGAMPQDAKSKLRKSMCKMVNDGKYRLFYIVY